MGKKSSVTFVGLILAVIMVWIASPAVNSFAYIIKTKVDAASSQRWPVVTAKVVGKAIVRYPQDNHESSNPIVTYEYTVDGVEFQDTVTLSGGGARIYAEAALSKVGNKIQVRYNPKDPETNVTNLDVEKYGRETTKVYIQVFGPVLILLVYFLFVILPAFRRPKRKAYFLRNET